MMRVMVLTGTRAEYGLLKPVIKRFHNDKDIELLLAVTGSHLSPKYGNTVSEIESDGFNIDFKVKLTLEGDEVINVADSMGIAISKMTRILLESSPDIIILLGDRYETFAVAIAATITLTPIAHLYGGEVTFGAIDEVFRHSITKASHFHFTSTESYRKRVIQLGEKPNSVFNVGSLGVENINKIQLLSKSEIETELDMKIDDSTVLVTFHPATMENNSYSQINELFYALKKANVKSIITKSNADSGGGKINNMIDSYVAENPNTNKAFFSLGQIRYLSTMKFVAAVVGNSSSGLIEAPSLGVPTVNIGDRQLGRIQPDSVINCPLIAVDIKNSIDKALSKNFQDYAKKIENPYEGRCPSEDIYRVIKENINEISIKKEFYDLHNSI